MAPEKIKNYILKPAYLQRFQVATIVFGQSKVLQNEKTGQILFEESLSGELPMTGQLSNHFIEGMRKIYELEPFIKLEDLEGDRTNKMSKSYKKAI